MGDARAARPQLHGSDHDAIQEIRTTNDLYRCGMQPKQVTACHEVVFERPASVFEHHPTHQHWHTGKAALFEVRKGSPTGPIAAGCSAKAGFCLIEVYRLEGNSKTSARAFWECNGTHQGAGSGRPVPPGHGRPGRRSHRPAERKQLLPRLDRRPGQPLPRDR